MTQTSMLEVELERLIERKLTGTTLEDRRASIENGVAEPLVPYGEYNGFLPGESDEMDRDKAINTVRLWSFLEKTQKGVLAEWRGRGDLRTAVEKEIDRNSTTRAFSTLCVKSLKWIISN